jgi:hypothetical protein
MRQRALFVKYQADVGGQMHDRLRGLAPSAGRGSGDVLGITFEILEGIPTQQTLSLFAYDVEMSGAMFFALRDRLGYEEHSFPKQGVFAYAANIETSENSMEKLRKSGIVPGNSDERFFLDMLEFTITGWSEYSRDSWIFVFRRVFSTDPIGL